MSLDDILRDPSLSVERKEERVAAFLSSELDSGIDTIRSVLLSAEDERVAHFVANHLALLPGYTAEKRLAIDRLTRAREELARSAASLIQFAAIEQLEPIVLEFIRDPSPRRPLFSLIFEIAVYFPGLLRPYWDQLEQGSLRQGMLSGAPDEWVDRHVANYRADHAAQHLETLGRFHTPRAASALHELRTEVPPEQTKAWEAFLEFAGLLEDGTTPSKFMPSLRGFVVERGRSPHAMGGHVEGTVPICPVCSVPTSRVLSLKSKELPLGLSGLDPSFFWFDCDCGKLTSTNVRITEHGVEVLIGFPGRSAESLRMPRERALLLEEHPNQTGISIKAFGGSGRHQVGGVPRWRQLEPLRYCTLCKKKMKVLATIESGMTPFGRLTFAGTLYCSWCDDCSVSVTNLQ